MMLYMLKNSSNNLKQRGSHSDILQSASTQLGFVESSTDYDNANATNQINDG